jgi:predicted helicase
MNVNVRACVKEREVKESVRIELVKALGQARFILTGIDIARSGFITTVYLKKKKKFFDLVRSAGRMLQYVRKCI